MNKISLLYVIAMFAIATDIKAQTADPGNQSKKPATNKSVKRTTQFGSATAHAGKATGSPTNANVGSSVTRSKAHKKSSAQKQAAPSSTSQQGATQNRTTKP